MILAIIWMYLENLILSKRSQAERPHFYDSIYRKYPKKMNPEMEVRANDFRLWVGESY